MPSVHGRIVRYSLTARSLIEMSRHLSAFKALPTDVQELLIKSAFTHLSLPVVNTFSERYAYGVRATASLTCTLVSGPFRTE